MNQDEEKTLQSRSKIKTKNIILKADTQKRIINSLTDLLKPSIDEKIYNKIEEVIFDLMKTPSKLEDEATINKLLNITNERVEQDRQGFMEKSKDIKKIVTLLANEFEKSIILSNNSSERLLSIKEDLASLEISKHSNRELNLLNSKIADVIFDLENNIEDSKRELQVSKETCSKLESEVKRLQNDLDKLKNEKDIDLLTGVLNRRGYTSQILKVENRYSLLNGNYAIIFIGIDNISDINSNHGHDCGDVVLKTFTILLKQSLRETDTICRYTEDSFVVLLSYSESLEVENYIKRIKNIVTDRKFILGENIKEKVTFSAGVSLRSNYNTYENSMQYADILLYKAKHEGKNQIIFDNDKVI